MRIVFPYIAQPHQTLHSLPIALEIARRHPGIAVHVACLSQEHEDYARHLASFYPDSSVTFDRLHLPTLLRHHMDRRGQDVLVKMGALFYNKNYFAEFQAIVVPERTSLYLRKMGVRAPRLIWTRHGAGDRAIGFAQDVRNFDFILMAGRKLENRLLAQGALRPGHYVAGIYAKFDMVRLLHQQAPPLFPNGRPTVLYNPHFSPKLSSWHTFGLKVLDYFASQDQYNLVFAPHYRLFDARRAEAAELVRAYAGVPHMRIDPGSPRSIDMTYTMGADLYLGDVSSQVAEFLVTPRPCLFLDAHATDWRDNPDYRFWTLGNVVTSTTSLGQSIDRAYTMQAGFLERQKSYIRDTFGLSDAGPTAPVGADAIVEFLRKAGP
ncbi:sensor domain-containing protein [Gluconacetobacter tumulisoli]|uniref:Sensor domain-containing protein n=1 Tax=Gluconacetobacter tumulisoli TaxID=1286189 RepID=A0A7W4K9U7_9PROT|nr:sensor domain-containing protein [Gluconacetobacter tumulisoli]MBB2202965.1 sensor domain-containing protein [Gluconacetobacter tumulisoli]